MLRFIKNILNINFVIKPICDEIIASIENLQEYMQHPVKKKETISNELNIIKEKIETILKSM